MHKPLPVGPAARWHHFASIAGVPPAGFTIARLRKAFCLFLLSGLLPCFSSAYGQDVLWGFTSEGGLLGGGTMFSLRRDGN
jgi:hypothetical protein